MDAILFARRMEKAIDAERDPVRRWAMRRELKSILKDLEGLR